MDADGRNLTKLTPVGYNPAWSPDGHEIAVAEDRIFDYEGRNHSHSKLFAVSVDTGDRRLVTSQDAVQPNWSPNGHRIAFWGVDKGSRKDIWTVAARGGEPVPVTDDQPSDWNPVWSRDGKYLYFLSDRGGSMNLWRVPIDEVSGRVTGRIEPATLPSANSQHFSFSADGKALVYVEMNRREGTFQIDLDPTTATIAGQPVQITQGIRRYSSPQISEDEKSLVFVSAAEAQEDLYIIDRDSGQLRQVTNDPAQDRVPRWSPDNRQIAFLSDRSGKYEIWKVNADGSGLEQITDVPDAELVDAIWSPDGQRLLYQVREVGSFIIDPNKSRESQTPQPLSGRPIPGTTPWAWSPDGKLIVGWQFDPQIPTTGLIIYSFADQKFERVTTHGNCPTWLSDSKRLLFTDLGKLYSFNVETRKEREIYNVGRNSFGVLTLSKDNRRLYYSLISTEADIHMLPIN
jgi:TolB protein